MYMTLDDACGYVRARHDTAISQATCTGKTMLLQLRGSTSRATHAYVFENSEAKICSSIVEIPAPAVTDTAEITMRFSEKGIFEY